MVARETAAIIDVAPERLAREIAKEHVALQDCERKLADAERKSDGLRQEQARRRIEIGRLLIDAKRTIKHGGWLPYLEKLGIERQRANEWMRLAGYVEEKCPTSPNAGHLDDAPTLADAGIDKRPRKSAEPDKRTMDSMRFMAGTIDAHTRKRDEQPDPAPSRKVDADPADDVQLVHRNNIDRALVALNKSILGYAKSWPSPSRIELARMLRGVADSIESMSDSEGEQ